MYTAQGFLSGFTAAAGFAICVRGIIEWQGLRFFLFRGLGVCHALTDGLSAVYEASYKIVYSLSRYCYCLAKFYHSIIVNFNFIIRRVWLLEQ